MDESTLADDTELASISIPPNAVTILPPAFERDTITVHGPGKEADGSLFVGVDRILLYNTMLQQPGGMVTVMDLKVESVRLKANHVRHGVDSTRTSAWPVG